MILAHQVTWSQSELMREESWITTDRNTEMVQRWTNATRFIDFLFSFSTLQRCNDQSFYSALRFYFEEAWIVACAHDDWYGYCKSPSGSRVIFIYSFNFERPWLDCFTLLKLLALSEYCCCVLILMPQIYIARRWLHLRIKGLVVGLTLFLSQGSAERWRHKRDTNCILQNEGQRNCL